MDAAAAVDDERSVEDALSYAILLSERVRSAAEHAESFKSDCSELRKQVDRLSPTLRSLVRFASSSSLYDRPVRRILSDICDVLDRALALARRCRRQNFLRRVVTITSAADFRKVQNLLDASVGDMKWLLSIFRADGDGGIELSLPPIASNDPILSWVWSFIASIHYGESSDRVEAANELASLAKDNDRNKQMIVEEGGIPPLLKLLKEGSDPEGQIAAATALISISNDQDRVWAIVKELGVPIIVQVLGESPMRVQILVANLVAKMAEHNPLAQEDFACENAIRPLVTLLAFDMIIGDDRRAQENGKASIHSILEMNRRRGESSKLGNPHNSLRHLNSYSYPTWDGSSRAGSHRREWENETYEVKLKLKTNCARALWMLSAGSISNSRRITETKGLLCLAKLIERERGELQYNCLMAVMEITSAAESSVDLRQAAFKTNSPAAKAVVEQLLRVIKEAEDKLLQIPAIRSIGSLARTFPARETRVIVPLVDRLGHWDPDVATEAAIALGKFACPANFLCTEHSRTIIELDAVPGLMRLLRSSERAQFHGLGLLCYLALHSGHNERLDQARVLTALEGADRSVAAQHPELKELIVKAMYHLKMYHSVGHSQRLSYPP
ncbi:uncharacterized protein LOC116210064 [Punica granatum]|uniref:DUF7792 domain-containing protein n=2 Tax=Punica granatum TaxID=22663 RepID=A0A218WTJ9_PUNGR|nr:uncharacterized protein LOC116210064 [Punica granatum]OWM76105.1 hypothetical protein CDL15_Pgr009751 [Punica granatum]PKI77142.1 hypothetical protein CRG98_002645 [Punica granatum]